MLKVGQLLEGVGCMPAVIYVEIYVNFKRVKMSILLLTHSFELCVFL